MAKANVQPLQNERAPANPIRPWVQPPDSYRYKVQPNDTWHTLAMGYQHFQWFDASHLIWHNFGLSPTERFNWYLREYVGCWKSLDGGKNWAFKDADPGYIFLPNKFYREDPLVITGKPSNGGVVSAPQYDDQNFYDTLSKALDIPGWSRPDLSSLVHWRPWSVLPSPLAARTTTPCARQAASSFSPASAGP